jgi:hypothetical protein
MGSDPDANATQNKMFGTASRSINRRSADSRLGGQEKVTNSSEEVSTALDRTGLEAFRRSSQKRPAS